jgi:hypothetical protein
MIDKIKNQKSKIKNIILFFILSVVVCLPLILPYFRAGFFPTHDGEWAVVRLSDMYRGIKDLQFPVRYSGYLNFQYGYPLFNFAYPLPYYFGLFFVFLKFGFVGSIKLLFSLSVVLSFITMFMLSTSIWKNRLAGLISAALYVYVPYRVVDLYVRGSIGESLSFVLFPLIILGVKRIYDKKDALGILFTAVSFAALILMHNIMTVEFGIFIGFIFLTGLLFKKIGFILKLATSFIFAFCISAFFWIPAIFEKHLILLSKIPIADRSIYFVKPLELIFPKWGYAVPTDPNGFGYQIGLVQLAVIALVIVLVIKNFLKRRLKEEKQILFLIISTGLITLLLFSFTSLIWSHVPFLSEINYPWTFLGVLMFLISLTAGYLSKQGKKVTLISLLFIVFALIIYLPHAKPQYYVNRGESFYITNQATTTSSNELMPLWVKKQPLTSWETKVEPSAITNLIVKSNKISFDISLSKEQVVRINTIYYPGWKIFVDGKETKINYNNPAGIMEINVPVGQHSIRGVFSETSLRLAGDLISIISILGVLGWLGYIIIVKLRK